MTVVDATEPVDATVVRALHIGRRDHYRHAAAMLDRGPARVVLMQRSSSLLLGAEAGWDDEGVFVAAAQRSITGGARWFHVASSAGIAVHLARPTSSFPDVAAACARLHDRDGAVAVGASADAALPVRDLPYDRAGDDFKLDRQARVLAADFDGSYEAILVTDVGERQCSIHQCGPYARDLFELCLEFWTSCPALSWTTLDEILAPVGHGRAVRPGTAG